MVVLEKEWLRGDKSILGCLRMLLRALLRGVEEVDGWDGVVGMAVGGIPGGALG